MGSGVAALTIIAVVIFFFTRFRNLRKQVEQLQRSIDTNKPSMSAGMAPGVMAAGDYRNNFGNNTFFPPSVGPPAELAGPTRHLYELGSATR